MIITRSVYEQFVTITELTPLEDGILIAQFDVGQNRFDKQDLLNSDSFFVSYQDAQDILDVLDTDEKFFDKSIDREHHYICLHINVESDAEIHASITYNRIAQGKIYETHYISFDGNDYEDFRRGLQQLVEAHNEAR